VGGWMYLISIALVAFILLNSVKKGIKLEIYTLICIFATLFFSSIVRGSTVDWTCLCGQEQERFFFFTIVFLLILTVRQLEHRKSSTFKLVFLAVMAIVVLNIASGFFIPVHAEENWKYVKNFYDPAGKYQCYIGEPKGWSITIPCSRPISSNTTYTNSSVTFIPPVKPTITTILPSSTYTIDGAPETFTAKISPIPDGGSMQFYIDGKIVGNSITIFDGQATYSVPLSIGTHQISATYFGAPNFNASTSNSITITVLPISKLKGINLSGANLERLNLSNVNMEDANLSDADLQGSNLTGADLRQANTVGTNFQGAITKGCIGCP